MTQAEIHDRENAVDPSFQSSSGSARSAPRLSAQKNGNSSRTCILHVQWLQESQKPTGTSLDQATKSITTCPTKKLELNFCCSFHLQTNQTSLSNGALHEVSRDTMQNKTDTEFGNSLHTFTYGAELIWQMIPRFPQHQSVVKSSPIQSSCGGS